jgi:excisionase family DNA binding protein
LADDKLATVAKKIHDEWMSVLQAARRLGITREAVYNAIKAGRLKARLKTSVRMVWQIDAKCVKAFTVSASHQKRGRRGARRRHLNRP